MFASCMWSFGCERSLGQTVYKKTKQSEWPFAFVWYSRGKKMLRNEISSVLFQPLNRNCSKLKNRNELEKSWSVHKQCLKTTPRWNFRLAFCQWSPSLLPPSWERTRTRPGVGRSLCLGICRSIDFLSNQIRSRCYWFVGFLVWSFVARVVNVTPPSSWASRSRRVDRCDVFTPFKLMPTVQSCNSSIFVSLILVWCRKTFIRHARIRDKEIIVRKRSWVVVWPKKTFDFIWRWSGFESQLF